ncbi:MAG TPA: Holliday junction branch migration protein RuvA [Flavobacteriales bacterium]|jgi:Holliday junction DNA helicase RuvA|nr:Holliday junction branch migration protein RuvA [Flavobacteriales bacterium]HIB77304.1 Holliday junction branch migration protein RuvA [Flavobacteriales bacterium]
MIYHLNGRLIEKHPTHVVIECGGVGYLVSISLTTFEALSDDESIFLNIHMVVREDAQTLFGFATVEERRMFLLLIGVSGVGANTARLILSAMDPATTTSVIAAGDADSMKQVKGIGAKTAQRIIIDLQDKVGAETGGGGGISEISSPHNTVRVEALGALATLGFDKNRVEKVLDKILDKADSDITLEALIKQALKGL